MEDWFRQEKGFKGVEGSLAGGSPVLLTLSVEPSLNAREELAAGCYCGDDTRVRGRRALEP